MKGQLGNEHGLAQRAGQVNAFAKRLQAKNHRGQTGLNAGLVHGEQAPA